MLSHLLTNIVVVAVVLGLMILVHELGHFIAAKWFGVRVLTFSLGFGKRLLGFNRGGTDYRISALPLGGYVKMAGDDPSEVRQGDPSEFLARPRWQRLIIAVMGPAMNVVMAVVLLAGLYRFHFPKPAYMEKPARVGDVQLDSPAARAGLQPGDLITALGNLQNPTWEDVEMKVLTTAGEAIPLQVSRDGQKVDLTLTPRAEGADRIGNAGMYPFIPAVIETVEPSMPAALGGLKPGDQIVGLDGRKLYCGPCLAFELQSEKGKDVGMTVLRDGNEFQVRVKPVYSEAMGEKKWRIGVAFRNDLVVRTLPWGRAITSALDDNLRSCVATFDVLGKILTRRMSARQLSGPIGIAQLSGEAYREGFPELVVLVSMISMQLGIFNLLPIPILDGGVILLLLIEELIRRDLSLEVKERFVKVGLVFLLLLAVFVMYNDIMKTLRPS